MLRRILLVGLLLSTVCVPARAAYTSIGNIAVTGGVNGGTSGTVNMTGANLFVFFISWYCGSGSGGSVAPSDSSTNTWNLITTATTTDPPGFCESAYYSQAPTVTSSQTFTITGSTTYSSGTVQGWSGAATSSVLDTSQSAVANSSATTLNPGSITPNEDNALIVAGCLLGNNSGTGSINAGFTISNQVAWSNNVREGGMLAYLVQTSAINANPQCNLGGAATGAAGVTAVFKPAGAAPGTVRHGLTLLGVGR